MTTLLLPDLHPPVPIPRKRQQRHPKNQFHHQQHEKHKDEEHEHGARGDDVVGGELVPFKIGVRGEGGGGTGAEGGAAEGTAENLVDVLECRGGDGGCGGRGVFFHREGFGGGGEWDGHVGCEEHVVGLDGGADEEAGQWDCGEAEAAGEVLVGESLLFRERVSYGKTFGDGEEVITLE